MAERYFVALATCRKLPEADPDEKLLVAALEEVGARVRMLAWDDERETPRADELVVLRSTWNYYEDADRFLAWVDETARRSRVLNPPEMVRRNARKTYLGDLESHGVDIVPTEYVGRGQPRRVEELTKARGWTATPIVIKPVVSAGSFLTQRFDVGALDEAQRFLDDMTRERDAMIQRWMPAVETSGERALVWIDGELSHAVRKSPRFIGGAESVSEAIAIAPDERAFAERVVAEASGPRNDDLLYARIDVVKDESGVLRLMELELVEPSLFLAQSPPALARFVQAIAARAQGR